MERLEKLRFVQVSGLCFAPSLPEAPATPVLGVPDPLTLPSRSHPCTALREGPSQYPGISALSAKSKETLTSLRCRARVSCLWVSS